MTEEDRKRLGAMFDANNQQFQANLDAMFPARKPPSEVLSANPQTSVAWGSSTKLSRVRQPLRQS
jgi:hypothetical protein